MNIGRIKGIKIYIHTCVLRYQLSDLKKRNWIHYWLTNYLHNSNNAAMIVFLC